MYENDVEVLNVAGSRASKDPLIYKRKRVFDIVKGVYWTDKIKGQNQEYRKPDESSWNVNTVDEAVDRILADFPLRDQVEAANLTEEDLVILQAVLADYIGDKMEKWFINKELYADCLKKAECELLDQEDASTVILNVLWDRLRDTHKLRVVKGKGK
jgi:hypothetical protein